MTDQNAVQTEVQETPIPGAESPVDERTDLPEGDDTGEQEENGNNREARYRVRAREAETALAAANARIEGYQRAEIERIASASLSHPSDVFTMSGNSVADYVDPETGNVDAQRVAADVAAILQERPGLKPPSPAYDRTQGHGGTPKSTPTFSDLLRP